MNTVEEKLWNYIDGSCTPVEQDAIRLLIEQDDTVRLKYDELLMLNSEFAAMEPDEPSMAFTYNVMEGIRKENALKPLKSAINQGIIIGIGLFFVAIITAMLIFALVQVNWASGAGSATGFKFNVPNFSSLFNSSAMEIFGAFDMVLALYLVDNYLRKKGNTKTDISVQTGGQHPEN